MKEALKLALEALETELSIDWTNNDEFNASAEKMYEAITAIKEALAQPEQEPVAWRHIGISCLGHGKIYGNWTDGKPSKEIVEFANKDEYWSIELAYTTPQQRKPLTDEQIFAIGKELGLKCRLGGNPNIDIDYARAIEAAHGIKE
jgi:hypothetical protein